MSDINDTIPGEDPKYNTLAKQLKAVQNYGLAIEFIKNPSELVQLAAVQKNGLVIKFILLKGIIPSIPVQKAAILQNPVWALDAMIKRNFPISKLIQWTAAKRIKEKEININKNILDQLDPDVQDYLNHK